MDIVYDYLSFVAGRHDIWVQRRKGTDWTTPDPLLRTRKFTNVFRVLDYGTQFVIRELLDNGTAERNPTALMRCFLYRYTNRPEPWVWYKEKTGRYPTWKDMEDGTLLKLWREYDAAGGVFFSSAYTMFSGGENPGVRRFEWAIGLAGQVPTNGRFYTTSDTQERVDILRQLPRTGFFMAQQVATDFGYIDNRYDENDWVAPGPGSLRGAAHLAPGADFHTVVDLCQDVLTVLEPQVHIELPEGKGIRYPSLMDVQNTLCEFDKYVRWRDKPLAKPYQPKHPGTVPDPVLPLYWEGQ